MQSKQYKWKLFGPGAALRKDKLGSDIEYLSAVQIGYGSNKKTTCSKNTNIPGKVIYGHKNV